MAGLAERHAEFIRQARVKTQANQSRLRIRCQQTHRITILSLCDRPGAV
jgi:hypothetical protein